MASSAAPALLRLDQRRGRFTLATTVLGTSMAFLDGTVVNIALPTIGRELHANLAGLQWVVNAYSLTLASLILLGGSLGDRFGRRRLYLVGVIAFSAASLGCALSPTVVVLAVVRALQGVAAALMVPGSLAILQSSFEPGERMRAIGAWTGLAGVATAAGPLVGGWLVGIDWRLVFWINIPIGIAVVALGRACVPESVNPHASRHLDPAGVVLAALGLAGLTWSLTAVPDRGWSAPVLAVGVAGVLCLGGFVLVEGRVTAPMVPLTMFASRTFSVVNAVTLAVYAALGGALFFLVIFLQVTAGWSPLAAGASTLPISITMLLLSSRFGALGTRIGPRPLMAGGTLLSAAGFVLLSRIPVHPSYLTDVLPGLVVFSVGLSMTVAPLTGTVLAAAPDELAGTASGVNNAIAQTARLLAVAALPLAVGLSGREYASPVLLAPAYRSAMLVCAGMLVAAAVLTQVGLRAHEACVTTVQPATT